MHQASHHPLLGRIVVLPGQCVVRQDLPQAVYQLSHQLSEALDQFAREYYGDDHHGRFSFKTDDGRTVTIEPPRWPEAPAAIATAS